MSYESDWLNESLADQGFQVEILEKAEAQYWGKIIVAGSGKIQVSNGTLLCAIPALDILAFNRVLGFQEKREINGHFLQNVIQFFQKVGSSRCMIQIPEPLVDEEIVHVLKSNGFRQHNIWSKLALPLSNFESQTANSHNIIEIKDELHKKHFGRIIQESFEWPKEMETIFMHTCGQPGFKHFLLIIDGRPSAAAAMHITGDVASMAIAGTLPEYRGFGAQKALLEKRLTLAKELGCKLAATETGVNTPEKPNISWCNMIKTGFREAYIRHNFVHNMY
jgi:GNAT superfamily N-acetyltransferase